MHNTLYTMDGPDEAVSAVVCLDPSAEGAGHRLEGERRRVWRQIWPGLADDVAADAVQQSQFDTAPPAPTTDGSLFAPTPVGTAVDGTTQARMEREDAARTAR